MKNPIPIIELGRLGREHLPAGHPDLHGIDLLAADLGCTVEEARQVVREQGINLERWYE